MKECLDKPLQSLLGVYRSLRKIRGREKLSHACHVCVYLYFNIVEGLGRETVALLFGAKKGEEGGKGGEEVVEECLRLCREVVNGATELFQSLFVLFHYVSRVFNSAPSSSSHSLSPSFSSFLPPITFPRKLPSLPSPTQTPGFLPFDSPLLPPSPFFIPFVPSPEIKLPPPTSYNIPSVNITPNNTQSFLSLFSTPPPPTSPSPSSSCSSSSSLFSSPSLFACASNEKAIEALRAVERKMNGIEKGRGKEKEGGEEEILSVSHQFDYLVGEAVSEKNLSKLYEGWLSWI
uniref:FATC domain-containing protein n=1 Tax=Paramoeba aestuarina TaxID=180227 RepID=A0A7S4PGN3_9EUKA